MYLKSAAAVVLLVLVGVVAGKDCHSKKSSSKLFCYYGKAKDIDSCKCSHIILPADADVKSIEGLRDKLGGTKILLTVNEFNEGLVNTLKATKVDGLEINLKKLDSKNDISDFISTVRSKLGSDLYLALSVPPKTETLAKYYEFKSLAKNADVFILQTHLLGVSKNVTFHPSRLSGLWDVQNTDSVVDLVSGLGAPLSKLVITAPVQGFKFTLQNEKHTAPGSPALELSTLTRDQLCDKMGSDKWMLERDQDQAGPYIFRKNEWVSFEDSMSMDIKAKYSRVRGLAGLALKDLSQDGGVKCGETLLESAYSGLSKQARAPRGAVLHSLEREILQAPSKILDNVQVSPYRISRVIDVEGKVHVIRQDTRTEFACSRQGYFVHPRSCGRFYRCVKFDQLSDEFSVFEFDCPAGLAFDERVEVCVWPGSLPHASACSGSSEIAPVPRERFICPGEQGYYADPENCRWFFACLDHGKSPLSAYEFRCPYGLVFDEERLMCEWSWLVPKCGSGYASGSIHGDAYYYGGLHNAKGVAIGLDLYDGLGTLNGIKLGGLSGPLVQPIQKTYSTFGTGRDIVANVFGVQPQISFAGSGNTNGFGGSGIYVSGSGSQYGQGKTADVGIVKVDHSQGYHAGADSARYHSSDGTGSYRFDNSGSYKAGNEDQSLGYHAGADSSRYHSSSDESGSYRHDNSGSYNAGNSGSYNIHPSGDNKNSGLYVSTGSSDESGSYRHDNSGNYKAGNSESYNEDQSLGYHAGADSARYHSSSDESGSYRHDNSGSYKAGNSGSYNIIHSGSSGDNKNSGLYVSTVTGGSGSINIDHSGGESGNHASDNSGSYKHDSSGSYNAVDSGAYSGENQGTYVGVSGSGNSVAGSGSINIDHSGSYNAGSYKHDGSGSFNGNSGTYVAVTGEKQTSGIHVGALGSGQSGAYAANSGSINIDHSGGYNAGESGSYISDNSGSYKHDGSGSFNGNSGAYVAVTGEKQKSGIYVGASGSGQSGAYAVNSGSINIDHSGNAGESGSYVSDNSGSYKHDASGSYNAGNSGAYVASSGENQGTYVGSEQSNAAGSGSYNAGGSTSYSGSYKHDASGSYNSGNSGAYSGEKQNSDIYVGVSGYSGANAAGTGSINIDHSGSYNAGYVTDNSGSYKHGDTGNSGAYVAVTGEKQNSGIYISGANAAGSGSINVDHSGSGATSYVSENSGSYKHDASGSYNVGNSGAYVAVSGEKERAGIYTGVSGANVGTGSINIDHSGSYNAGGSSSFSGSYKHDASGSYKTGDSGAYVAVTGNAASGISSGSGSYNAEHSAQVVNANSGIYSSGHAISHSSSSDESGSYKEDNSGAYVEDNSGSYVADNSGSYKEENSGSYNSAHSGSYNSDNSGSYHGSSSSVGTGNTGSYVVQFDSGKYKSEESGAGSSSSAGTGNAGSYVVQLDSGKYKSGESGSSYSSFASDSSGVSSGGYKSNTEGGSYSYSHSSQSAANSNYGHEQEQLGQVNIIAGGVSGVGVAKGVELIQHGINLGGVEHVTPLTIVSSTIPSVTSVPLPAKSGLEFFNGGVVANVPDLQLKLEHPSTINAYLGNFETYKDAKVKDLGFSNYTHFVSSTQAPLVLKSDVISSGFDVAKVNNVEDYKQSTIIGDNRGYVYSKPSVTFEEKPTYLPPAPSTYLPPAPSTYLPPIQSTYLPAVSTTPATYLPPVSPTVYLLPSTTPKPTAVVYLPPAPSTYLPPKSYSYGQRTSHKSSYVIPSKPIQGLKFGVVESQSYHNRHRGYQYARPTIAFEEKPNTIVQPAVTYQQIHHKAIAQEIKPVIIHKEVQPAITFHQSEGYHYEQPTIAFGEKTVQPAVAYQEIKQVQPVVHEVKIDNSEGYHYEKPAVAFEEKPVVLQEIKPAVSFGHKTNHKSVSYQEVKHETAQQSEEYHYETPSVVFEEKPVIHEHKVLQPAVTYHESKPAVAYQEIKHETPAVTYQEVKHESYDKSAVVFGQKEIVQQTPVTYQEVKVEHQGYKYEKPAVTFEEKPQVHTYVHHKQAEHKGHQAVSHKEGYHYEKPSVVFEEKPVAHIQQEVTYPAVTVHEVKPTVTFVEKPQVHTYVHHKQAEHKEHHAVSHQEGYHYEKPSVVFEEKPVVHVQQPIIEQQVTYQEPAVTLHESKPAVTFIEKPQVHTYVHHKQAEHKENHAVSHQEGYHYEKPSVVFEEKPIVHVQQPIVEQKVTYQEPAVTVHEVKPAVTYQEVNVQPAVAYQEVKPAVTYQNIQHNLDGYYYKDSAARFEHKQVNVEHKQVEGEGYHYEKPAVVFEEGKQNTVVEPAVTYQNIHIKPAVVQHNQEGYYYKDSAARFEHKQVNAEHKQVEVEGYHYEKPAIAFEEVKQKTIVEPAVTYQNIHIKPAVVQHNQEGYYYKDSAARFEHKQVEVEGYHYEKPAIAFEEVQKKTVEPAVTYQEISQPIIQVQKPTYKEIVTKVSKPTIISSFSIQQPVQKIVHEQTYLPPAQPTQTYLPVQPVKTYVPSQPKETYLPVPKPTLEYLPAPKPTLEYLPALKETYLPVPKPTLEYLPAPEPTLKYLPAPEPSATYIPVVKPVETYVPVKQNTVVESYFHQDLNVKPAVSIDYSGQEEVSEEPIVAKKTFLTYQKESGYDYPKPEIKFEEEAVVKDNNLYSYGQKEVIAGKENIPVLTTSRPIVRYEFSSLDDKYNNYENYEIQKETYVPVMTRRPVVTSPRREYLPVTTPTQTYLPVTTPKQTYLPVKTLKRVYLPVTTASPDNEYLPVTQEIYRIKTARVTSAKPSREYLPATTARPSKEYLPVKTAKPSREYLPVTTAKPSKEYLPVTTEKLNREYLPVRSRTRKPSREYLPVTSEQPSLEYLPVIGTKTVSTRRPKTKITKSKTIVKVNDFHPILSAKLGAQCTCVSNTLTLRKKGKNVNVERENYPIGYEIQGDNYPSRKDGYIERDNDDDDDYDEDNKDVIKDAVDVVVEDFKYEPERISKKPTEAVYIQEPSSEAIEIFVNKGRKQSVRVIKKKKPSKEEISEAVDTGLKLVKSAVKEGVKEGVKEALESKDFDRYGPGGVRGRTETLQGTIDCQRAGLFRHPKHCNKFYACRWDDGKKKFTLHVFNCPVHLTFDNNLGACNWPSQGPACVDDTLLPSV